MDVRFLLIGFACVVAAVLALAIAVKWWEVRKASRWLPAPGRIVSSRVVQREVNAGEGRTEMRNFPAITFTYKVGNRTYRGDRYSIRENLGNTDVSETLQKFRKGAEVTVFYNPDDPGEAVIERDMPEGAFQALSLVAALIVVGAVALVFGTTDIVRWLRPICRSRDRPAWPSSSPRWVSSPCAWASCCGGRSRPPCAGTRRGAGSERPVLRRWR